MSTPTLTQLFTNIADQIRNYTFGKKAIPAVDFPLAIDDVAKIQGAQIGIAEGEFTSGDLNEIQHGSMAEKITKIKDCFVEYGSGVALFTYFISLESVYNIDTSSVEEFRTMFSDLAKLSHVDVLDTKNAIDMENMFWNCPSLDEETINNILLMCIGATSFYGTKTFTYLGLLSTNSGSAYQSWAQASDYYQDFLDAGWSIS